MTAPLEDLGIRERLEAREESLSPHAQRSPSTEGRGRERPEPPDPLGTAFQVDRDRILHTKAFRRLMHKTQVFIAPLGDHYVTRMTHTLEVASLSRTIARALELNEDLAEAIALGHDLGHTPFGHLGEGVLAELSPAGFRHNRQSLRIVDVLEGEGRGLNLTWEVRQGILTHSKARKDIVGNMEAVSTLEAQAVRLCDAIAYINHDLDDAFRAGMLTEADLPPLVTETLGASPHERRDTLIADVILASWAATGRVPQPEDKKPEIRMSPRVQEAANALREFLFQRCYLVAASEEQAERAREVLRLLYRQYTRNPDKVTPEFRLHAETPQQAAVDYIAGMTDRYALRMAEEIKPGISKGIFEHRI